MLLLGYAQYDIIFARGRIPRGSKSARTGGGGGGGVWRRDFANPRALFQLRMSNGGACAVKKSVPGFVL